MPLRLAILGHFPVDGPPQGGVQSVIANLRDEFAGRGDIDLHLIQHRRNIPDGVVVRDGYTMHNIAARDAKLIPNMARTRALLQPLLAQLRPDALSSHQPEYALAAFASGIPTVHTIHGFPAHEFWTRRGLSVRAATLWEAWAERKVLRQARYLIAISDLVVRLYQGRTKARFSRIDNPVSPLFFEPSPTPQSDRLLFVGNLTTRKGVEVALEAVRQLRPDYPELKLDIYGRAADPHYAQQMRAQAAQLGGSVIFHGTATQVEIKQALGRSQALVLTSHEEHAPVIVAEAMASGRPVVATEVGALAGMVEHGRTGFLAARGDATDIAAHLAALLSDPGLAAQMGMEAARRAQERYHPRAVGEGYLRTIEEAMNHS
ncbi:MAG: glycosyltransferase family 4 protein [Caldilineales bacterium]|nr:glycosyltransferase family 4 protein [Caldilineales bacterium]